MNQEALTYEEWQQVGRQVVKGAEVYKMNRYLQPLYTVDNTCAMRPMYDDYSDYTFGYDRSPEPFDL